MRSKTAWLHSFVLMLKRASFSLFAHCTIPHLLAEVWCICHGVCKHAWNGDLKPSRVPALCVLLGCGCGWILVLLWWNGRSCQVWACPRGLLLQRLVVGSMQRGGFSLDLSGRAWGCPLFQKGVIQCKNPHRARGKCLLPNQFPSYCAHLCISPSEQPSLWYCRFCKDKIFQILQCQIHAVSTRHLGFEKAVVVFWCTWFWDGAFLSFKADISVVGEIVFFAKVHFHLCVNFSTSMVLSKILFLTYQCSVLVLCLTTAIEESKA